MNPDENITRQVVRGECGIPKAWVARKGGSGEQPEAMSHADIPNLSFAKIVPQVDKCFLCNQEFGKDAEIETENVNGTLLVKHKSCKKPAPPSAESIA